MKIIGIGEDEIEMSRVYRMVERHPNNLHHIYTQLEIERCRRYKEGYATHFAAKEAVSKALGTGISAIGRRELGGVSMSEIEVTHTPLGQPQVVLYGKAKRVAEEKGIEEILITMTTRKEDGIARALVIAQGKDV